MYLSRARKTPLALAIVAGLGASHGLQAQTLDVSGRVPVEFYSDLTESLTLTGTASGSKKDLIGFYSSVDLIEFGGIQIHGDVTNQANLAASGDSISAIDVDDSDISGIFTNAGTLSSQGNPVTALDFAMSSVQGIVNSGSIHSSGAMNPNDDETVNGLLVWDTQVGAGGILNTGEITAEGEDSFALKIEFASHVDGDLRNDGLIQATGNRSTALSIGDESSLAGALINNGSIRADGTAIRFEPSTINPGFLQITQNGGLIDGGETAINGSGRATLNLNGGTVRGDIRGIYVINVVADDAVIDSELIQAQFLEIDFTDPSKRLRLQRAHSELDGKLELLSGNLELLVGQTTEPERAILEVSGRAEVAPGFKVLVTPTGNDFNTAEEGRNYKLIQAQSWFKLVEDDNHVGQETALDGTELTVQSTSALLEVLSYNLDATTLSALLKAHTGQQAANVVAAAGGSPNAQNAIAPFSALLSGLAADDPLLQAFANADANQTRRLTEQLATEINGGATQAVIDSHGLINNSLSQRSSSLRGLSSGDGLSQTGVWLQVLDSDADQGTRSGIAGYDADSQGILIGADAKLNAQTTLGLAYSYLTSDVRSQTGNKTDIEGHALTLYSGFEQGAWFADASLTYGKSDNESKRYIAGTRAKGDYDSGLWGLSLLGGYGFDIGRGLLLEPRVAARYSNLRIDSFREKGSSAALAVGEQRFEVGELGAGVRLAGHFAAGQGSLEPEAKLMAYHDFIADRANSTSSFLIGGTPFTTHGATPARDSYAASLGLTYRRGAVSLGVGYDYLGKADFSSDTLQAKVRYDF